MPLVAIAGYGCVEYISESRKWIFKLFIIRWFENVKFDAILLKFKEEKNYEN